MCFEPQSRLTVKKGNGTKKKHAYMVKLAAIKKTNLVQNSTVERNEPEPPQEVRVPLSHTRPTTRRTVYRVHHHHRRLSTRHCRRTNFATFSTTCQVSKVQENFFAAYVGTHLTTVRHDL